MNHDSRADDRARWNQRYRLRAARVPSDDSTAHRPPPVLVRLASLLPGSGRAVDLAGGDGQAAQFLADRGLSPIVVDVADVALELARNRSVASGAAVDTFQSDLSGATLGSVLSSLGGPAPSLVTCVHYLERSLLSSVATDLPVGCRFLAVIATTRNLERHPRPSARYLLEPGELARLVLEPDRRSRLALLHRREGWAEDRHRAEIVVEARGDRRPGGREQGQP